MAQSKTVTSGAVKTRTSVSLSSDAVKILDTLVDMGLAHNRSEALEKVLFKWQKSNEKDLQPWFDHMEAKENFWKE